MGKCVRGEEGTGGLRIVVEEECRVYLVRRVEREKTGEEEDQGGERRQNRCNMDRV